MLSMSLDWTQELRSRPRSELAEVREAAKEEEEEEEEDPRSRDEELPLSLRSNRGWKNTKNTGYLKNMFLDLEGV